MTRDDVSRTLRMMERVREDSMEAESKAEERRLVRQYGQMLRAIEPYVTAQKPYDDESAEDFAFRKGPA